MSIKPLNYFMNAYNQSKSVEPPTKTGTSNPTFGAKLPEQLAMDKFEKQINDQNALVKRHEESHRTASGKQAIGTPVYETVTFQGKTLITGGHQNIEVPTVANKNSSLKAINDTIEAAKLTVKGAEAPSSFDELSGADVSVAFRGRQILAEAENAKRDKLSMQDKTRN